MRALFVNEGVLGAGMFGHGALGEALGGRLAAVPGLEARFRSLPPLDGVGLRVATATAGPLSRQDLDFQVARWHLVQALRARRLVQEELAREPADVLHVHSHTIGLGLTDVMRRIPTLLSVDATIWDWRTLSPDPVRAATRLAVAPSLVAERRAFAAAHTVLAWSDWAHRGVLARQPRAHVVRHDPGVDLEHFTPAERDPRERPRVLFVGGRFADKGGDDLLAALDPLLERGEAELDVVTAVPVEPRRGLRVHRLGPADPALVELYRQADVFCVPTLMDSYLFALREAMACGTAVVSTPVGGIEELLGDGRAGVLVPPRDPVALRAVLVELLGDPERRRALGTVARERSRALSDAAHQGDRLVELLLGAADQGRS